MERNIAGCLGRIQVDIRKVSSTVRIKILNDYSNMGTRFHPFGSVGRLDDEYECRVWTPWNSHNGSNLIAIPIYYSLPQPLMF